MAETTKLWPTTSLLLDLLVPYLINKQFRPKSKEENNFNLPIETFLVQLISCLLVQHGQCAHNFAQRSMHSEWNTCPHKRAVISLSRLIGEAHA